MFSYPAVLNVNTSYVGPGYKSEHMCIFIIYQTYNHLKKKKSSNSGRHSVSFIA